MKIITNEQVPVTRPKRMSNEWNYLIENHFLFGFDMLKTKKENIVIHKSISF